MYLLKPHSPRDTLTPLSLAHSRHQAFSIEVSPSSGHQGSSSSSSVSHLVCASCARVLRSRTRVRRLDVSNELNRDFSCAMGRAKHLGIKHTGSFKCLNGKVQCFSLGVPAPFQLTVLFVDSSSFLKNIFFKIKTLKIHSPFMSFFWQII